MDEHFEAKHMHTRKTKTGRETQKEESKNEVYDLILLEDSRHLIVLLFFGRPS